MPAKTSFEPSYLSVVSYNVKSEEQVDNLRNALYSKLHSKLISGQGCDLKIKYKLIVMNNQHHNNQKTSNWKLN